MELFENENRTEKTGEFYNEPTKTEVYEAGRKRGRTDLLIEMGYWLPLM